MTFHIVIVYPKIYRLKFRASERSSPRFRASRGFDVLIVPFISAISQPYIPQRFRPLRVVLYDLLKEHSHNFRLNGKLKRPNHADILIEFFEVSFVCGYFSLFIS